MEQKIKNYRQVYRLHMINLNLPDNSNTIPDKAIIDYVDTKIVDGDKKWYGLTIVK
jgi:hypothetical protein